MGKTGGSGGTICRSWECCSLMGGGGGARRGWGWGAGESLWQLCAVMQRGGVEEEEEEREEDARRREKVNQDTLWRREAKERRIEQNIELELVHKLYGHHQQSESLREESEKTRMGDDES
eukprot:755808-Hanusia_phi.AAC.1